MTQCVCDTVCCVWLMDDRGGTAASPIYLSFFPPPHFFNCDVSVCRRRPPVTDERGRNPDVMFGAEGGIPVINFFSSSFSPSRHANKSLGTGLRSLSDLAADDGGRVGRVSAECVRRLLGDRS